MCFFVRGGQGLRCDGSARYFKLHTSSSVTSSPAARSATAAASQDRARLAERSSSARLARKCFLQPSIRLPSKSHPFNLAGPDSPSFSFHLRRFPSAPCGAIAVPARPRTHARPTHTCRGTERLAPSSPRGVIVFCERCKVFTFLHNSNHKGPLPPLSPSWTPCSPALCSFFPSSVCLYEKGVHVEGKNFTSLLSCTIPSLPSSFSSPALPYFYHHTGPLLCSPFIPLFHVHPPGSPLLPPVLCLFL